MKNRLTTTLLNAHIPQNSKNRYYTFLKMLGWNTLNPRIEKVWERANLMNTSTNKSPPVGSRGICGTENPDIRNVLYTSICRCVDISDINAMVQCPDASYYLKQTNQLSPKPVSLSNSYCAPVNVKYAVV